MIKRQRSSVIKSKIYAMGFPRCGTTSLHKFFNQSGIKSIHNDNGKLASKMWYNFNNNLPLYYGYEKYQAFTNIHVIGSYELSHVGYYFRAIIKQDPDALFILNTRNIDNWIDSILIYSTDIFDYHDSVKLIDRYVVAYNFKSRQQAALHLRTRWHANMASVRHCFPKDRLLIFDIERDDPVKLCNFIGLDKKYRRYWGKHNKSVVYKNEWKLLQILKSITPQIVKNIFPRIFKESIRKIFLKHDENVTIVRI